MTTLNWQEFARVERSLAITCARADIESYCQPGPRGWWDAGDCDPDAAADVVRAVAYLETLGLLDRHPKRPAMVSVLRAEAEE